MNAQYSPPLLRQQIIEILEKQGLSTVYAHKLSRNLVTEVTRLLRETKPLSKVTITDSYAIDGLIRIMIKHSSHAKPREVLKQYLFGRGVMSKEKYPDAEKFRISDAFGDEGLPARVYIARIMEPDEEARLRTVRDLTELMGQEEAEAILTRLTDRKPPDTL